MPGCRFFAARRKFMPAPVLVPIVRQRREEGAMDGYLLSCHEYLSIKTSFFRTDEHDVFSGYRVA
jgi:hypothetical protein